MASLLTGWLLAVLLGARHASEPDHVVAVSTLVADAPNPRRAALQGALWGFGHALALLVAGVCLMALQRALSERIAALFELVVAGMLLLLGGLSIRRAFALHKQPREHHEHRAEPVASHTHPRKPLLVGLVHGLAGSGALTALALAAMPSFGSALVYVLCFGAGSVLGMSALAGLAGLPLRWLSRTTRVQAQLCAFAGVCSVVFGFVWGLPLLEQLSRS